MKTFYEFLQELYQMIEDTVRFIDDEILVHILAGFIDDEYNGYYEGAN